MYGACKEDMFDFNKKIMISITLFLSLIASTQITFSQQEPNYESVYKLHLKWDIEDLNKRLVPLEKQRAESLEQLEEMQTHRTERLQIQKEIESLGNKIEQLKNEAYLTYHLYIQFEKLFKIKRRRSFKYGQMGADIETLGKFLYAYVLFPISIPVTAFNAQKEWLSKKDNADQIALLEIELRKNQDRLNSLKPPTPEEVAVAKAETAKVVAKIESEIEQIQSKIRELEIEQAELKHLNHFKANFKFRHIN